MNASNLSVQLYATSINILYRPDQAVAQICPMNLIISGAVPFNEIRTELGLSERFAGPIVKDSGAGWTVCQLVQDLPKTHMLQSQYCVWTQRDAGAHFTKARCRFQNPYGMARPEQREADGEPANAGTNYQILRLFWHSLGLTKLMDLAPRNVARAVASDLRVRLLDPSFMNPARRSVRQLFGLRPWAFRPQLNTSYWNDFGPSIRVFPALLPQSFEFLF